MSRSRMDAAGAPDPAANPTVLLEETKTLVSELYHPRGRTPAELKAIQERLQVIQKCPQGWQIADGLLGTEDTDMRFFGALTFTVKINQDWNELSEKDIQDLLTYLMDRFVALVNSGEKALVIRKLASSLIAIFLKPNTSWNRAICDLAASLSNRNQVPKEQYLPTDFEGAALPALNELQIVALLQFSTTMAEEAVKHGSQVRRSGDHPVADNIRDAFCLCDFVLRHILRQYVLGNPVDDVTIGIEALESYRAWLNVRANIRLREPVEASELSSPMENLVQCLGIPGLSKTAAEILTELLGSGDKALAEWHLNVVLEYLVSDAGSAHVVALLDGDYEDEHMAFLELVLAYCSSRRVDLLCGALTPTHERLLAYLDTLFHGPGYPGAEDKVAPHLLEWWTEAADELQELSPADTENTKLEYARQNLAKAVFNCFGRLLYPSREQLDQWDSDDKSEFHSFRRDARDFLLAAYPTLGVELVQLFQQRAQSALESENWKNFEASIFCLDQLSEAVDGNDQAAQCLNSIFFDDKFAALCASNESHITLKARQTLVDMLGKYEIFFERTRELLPRVLTFLFASLNVPSCTSAASRSISSLCKSCRSALTSELPVFLNLFAEFHRHPVANVQNLERVVEGIAAVVQALDTDEAKVPYLNDLLSPFHAQAMAAREDARAGDVEAARTRGHLALSCIASIGRGLRADGDGIVDLESDRNSHDTQNTFWASHPCQQGIIQCLEVFLSDFPLDVTIIEGVCEVLKAGFTEKTGLYVFHPRTTATFLANIPLGITGAADVVMSTASAFLASHKAHPEEIREEAGLLIIHVYHAFRFMLENPQQRDPEIANSGIGFLVRLLPKYYHILFSLTSPPPAETVPDNQAGPQPPVLSTILDFTLTALQGPEPLPLRSATQFWVGTLSIPTTSEAVQQAIHEYLPKLCHVLITQVGGGCARSDLNHLSEVLKKIIFKYQGAAQPHLAAALAALRTKEVPQLTTEQQQEAAKEQERFLAMVFGARGSAATNQIVRQFWVKCRGAGFEYTE
ncbi:hypothetical protein VTN77DRAFT_2911 [Rasamsonia byssochlamydoides]|uniref:uncharacterized protein n=1 Tax=Rasamsonia byssochlamydoides TaxID=89139 RepID=UPI003742D979